MQAVVSAAYGMVLEKFFNNFYVGFLMIPQNLVHLESHSCPHRPRLGALQTRAGIPGPPPPQHRLFPATWLAVQLEGSPCRSARSSVHLTSVTQVEVEGTKWTVCGEGSEGNSF